MLGSLGEITSHGARTYGDKTALVTNGRSFSFTEIDHLACQLSNGLKARGVNGGVKWGHRGGVKRGHRRLRSCPRSPREGPARDAACPSTGLRGGARGRDLWAHGVKRGHGGRFTRRLGLDAGGFD